MRKTIVTVVATAFLLGAGIDPAHAAVVALPTGNISTSGVTYQVFKNTTNPDEFNGSVVTAPGFGIGGATELDQNRPLAYDGAWHLTVNGKAFTDANSSVDISPNAALGATGQTVSKINNKIGSVSISQQLDLFGGGLDEHARQLVTFKNKSTTKKAKLSVVLTNASGSDSATRVELTTDGDALFEPAVDSWLVLSNDGPTDDDVVSRAVVNEGLGNTTAKTGQFVSNDPVFADTLQVKYALSIKPGKTAKLLFFHHFDDEVVFAEADGPVYNTLATLTAAGLLVGITGPFKNWS